MPTLSNDVQAVLATDKVRFQGQEVAFVVAEDRYAARDALELIDVEYDILAAGRRRPHRRWTPDAPVIRDDLEGKTDNHCFDWETGDKPRPPRRCSPRPTSWSPRTSSTRGCTRRRWRPAAASPTSTRSTASSTLWTTTRRRTRTARSTRSSPGLPEHKIRVDLPRHRRRLRQQGADLPRLRLRDRRLACVTGKPVKWMEDRSENLISTGFARDYVMRGEIAATKDGKILAHPHPRARRPRRVQRHRGARRSTRPASSASSPAATTSRPPTAR